MLWNIEDERKKNKTESNLILCEWDIYRNVILHKFYEILRTFYGTYQLGSTAECLNVQYVFTIR